MALDLGNLLGQGVASTGLDVDNALYTTAASQTVDPKEQQRFIFWAHVLEFGARLGLLAISLYLFSGSDKLFTLFGVDFTPPMLAMMVAGVFLLFTNIKELDGFLIGAEEEKKEITRLPFNRALVEATIVNTVLSIDTVVAVADMTDEFAGMAIILSVSAIIRLLFLRQIAGFMAAHPEAKIITSSFLILIGISLVLQGVAVEFPEEGFTVGLAIAFILLIIYRRYGSAWFRGEKARPVVTGTSSEPEEPVAAGRR